MVSRPQDASGSEELGVPGAKAAWQDGLSFGHRGQYLQDDPRTKSSKVVLGSTESVLYRSFCLSNFPRLANI